VDYALAFSRMRRVLSFAGIGALWRVVNHRVPAVLVDGRAGDQRWNGAAAARLGLAAFFPADDAGNDLQAACALVDDEARIAAAMAAFRAPENYSDTIESTVDRIERLGRP
jgi:hypothetical protein